MKKLLVVLGVLLALLVVAWLVVTSSGFLKSVVLPRVASALNARVDAERIAWSPFSTLEIRGLNVVPQGAEPLAAAELVRVRYDLFAILGGRIAIGEVLVQRPKMSLVRNPDGSSNLDPILKQLAGSGGASRETPAKPGKPLQLDLRSLRVEEGTLSYRATGADGALAEGEVTGLNLSLNDLANAKSGRMEAGAGFRWNQQPGSGGDPTDAASATGRLTAAFEVGLAADLVPSVVRGKAEARLTEATGILRDFQGFSSVMNADLTTTELKEFAVEFARQGAALGSVRAMGPLDLARKEGKVHIVVAAIDRQVLNLVGAPMGIDFLTTRFDSTNDLVLASGGQRVGVTGSVLGRQVAVRQGDLTMPPVDLAKTYDLEVDLAGQTLTLKAFSLRGRQGGREILRGDLSQPMQIAWGSSAAALPDAEVQLALADVRLADWSALAGQSWQGTLQADARFGIRGQGQDLAFAVKAGLSGVSGSLGTNAVKNLGLTAQAEGALARFARPADRRLTMTAGVQNLNGEVATFKFERQGLEAKLDVSLPENRLTIHRGDLALARTTRAKNEVQLTGDLDYSRTNALKGGFRIEAESLDLTPYFDLMAGGPASTPPAEPTPPATGGPMEEPAAVTLPVDTLSLEARVGKLYLREILAENLQAAVKVEGSRVAVEPFQLALNGAPVSASARVNLGVPGYEYDLKFSANQVPVKPLADSFVPMLQGRIEGTVLAGLAVKGAGVTGVNLQKTLVGSADFAVTNANLKLTDAAQKKGMLSVLTGLLATALNIRELKDRPIMEILAHARLGQGRIDLTEARARSASLTVETTGNIPIAGDLMQSPVHLPVNVALHRDLAEKARLVTSDTPTNAEYVAIPTIASLQGTLGAPKPEVDKVQAGILAARGVAGLVGGQTGAMVGGVADMVGGVARGGTNAARNLIRGLGNLLGSGGQPADAGATNAPSAAGATGEAPAAGPTNTTSSASTKTETNAPPANPLGNALRGLFEKKKD